MGRLDTAAVRGSSVGAEEAGHLRRKLLNVSSCAGFALLVIPLLRVVVTLKFSETPK